VEAVTAAPHALSVERRTLQSSAAEEAIAVGDVEEATVLDADGVSGEDLRPEQQLEAVLRLSFGEAGLLLLEAGRTVPWVVSSLEGPHTSLAKDDEIPRWRSLHVKWTRCVEVNTTAAITCGVHATGASLISLMMNCWRRGEHRHGAGGDAAACSAPAEDGASAGAAAG
jgi:hypothetical protein